MCTAMTLQSQSGEQFFGRTMDFSHDIKPQLYIIPNSYQWNSLLDGQTFTDTYRFIGFGQELDDMLAFFDGVNEHGFAAAVLYFAGYAQYQNDLTDHTTQYLASIDFLHYILGSCASVQELSKRIDGISVAGITDPVTNTIAPLHWIVTDKSGACAVIEPTKEGLEFINNPIGVMANSPSFPWHMTNLRNYMGATPTQKQEVSWGNVCLTPFGQGQGTMPLPGGFTSPERFVRTSYLKTHIPVPKTSQEGIISCFHIMESVSIPKGAVITSQNADDYTKYTAFINTNTCEYFYKTYDNINITKASLWHTESDYHTKR